MRKGRCDRHAKQERKRYDRMRGTARERGYDSTWDRLSRQYRREHPLCEMCLDDDRTTPAELVHHVVPLTEGGARLDRSNLQSLCRGCHEQVHGEDT